jgi:hypothetical protein
MIQTSRNAALALALAALLTGCTYDYASRLDRVSNRAGNAVKANLALHTINPSKKSMYKTDDLGKDGHMPIVDVVVKDPVLGDGDSK